MTLHDFPSVTELVALGDQVWAGWLQVLTGCYLSLKPFQEKEGNCSDKVPGSPFPPCPPTHSHNGSPTFSLSMHLVARGLCAAVETLSESLSERTHECALSSLWVCFRKQPSSSAEPTNGLGPVSVLGKRLNAIQPITASPLQLPTC